MLAAPQILEHARPLVRGCLHYAVGNKKGAVTIPLRVHGHASTFLWHINVGGGVEKPFSRDRLIEAIKGAVDKAHRLADDQGLQRSSSRVDKLSERQKQVMDLRSKGLPTNEIARNLQISPSTVEIYRAWVMERAGLRKIAELVRAAILAIASGASAFAITLVLVGRACGV